MAKRDCGRMLKFWASLIYFLFMKRTEEEIKQLLGHLDHCSCPMGVPGVNEAHIMGKRWEGIWAGNGQRVSQALVQGFFHLSTTVLDQAHVRAVAKGISKTWPTSPKDLIRFGPQQLVLGLINWKYFISDMVAFKVAAQYIRLCGALILPSFIISGFLSRVIVFGRKFCDGAWEVVRRPKANCESKEFKRRFYLQAEPLVAYFSVALDDHTYQTQLDIDDRLAHLPKSGDFLEKVQDIGARAYQLVEKFFIRLPAISVFPGIFDIVAPLLVRKDAARSDRERTFLSLGIVFSPGKMGPFRCTVHVGRVQPSEDADLTERDLGRSSKITNDAVTSMRPAKYTLRCSATFCPNSIRSTGRDFQRCGKCGVALYCGKECQRASWRDKNFPHKEVCPLLSRLVEQGGGDDVVFQCPRPGDPKYFPAEFSKVVVANWEAAGVLRDSLENIVLWGEHLMGSGRVQKQLKKEPGFDDYRAFVRELAGLSVGRQGTPAVLVSLAYFMSIF
ncbi:hypothetical protein M413DRAFT_26187 [Hebeloma cylindrosporum]|uniref:MYND-type domain-containing protein n=1 Tax=Hebeloma cylindrosporum TaxID=76867 RepID=A0A0C3CFM2_HEBCY|nr:hypothetical protein M413DRAFT_26187 [Hebeloma cylindrosporum h7]